MCSGPVPPSSSAMQLRMLLGGDEWGVLTTLRVTVAFTASIAMKILLMVGFGRVGLARAGGAQRYLDDVPSFPLPMSTNEVLAL